MPFFGPQNAKTWCKLSEKDGKVGAAKPTIGKSGFEKSAVVPAAEGGGAGLVKKLQQPAAGADFEKSPFSGVAALFVLKMDH